MDGGGAPLVPPAVEAGGAQLDPLSGQQAQQAGAPMGNGVISAAPAPSPAKADSGLLPITPLDTGLDLSGDHPQPQPAATEAVDNAAQPASPAPGLLSGGASLPPQAMPQTVALHSQAEVSPAQPALPPSAALAPASPAPWPAPEQPTVPAPGLLPIPAPDGGTLVISAAAASSPSGTMLSHGLPAALAPPAPAGFLPPPRPGLQRVNSQSPAIRPGLQPANPALMAAAASHPGAAVGATPGASTHPPLAARPPPQSAPQLGAPSQQCQQQPGHAAAAPMRSTTPSGGAALPPGTALPAGYGFTAGQLTCLRQQIMTFRKLKARPPHAYAGHEAWCI